MEGPISFWGYKEQESNLILPEHDDDDNDDDGDTRNNGGNWNHLKIIQKIPQQHNGKGQNQGTTKKQPYLTLHTYFRKY